MEEEARLKNQKAQDVKKLLAQNVALESEIDKFTEQLKDCKKYKDFLEELTPDWYKREWQERRQKQIEAQKAAQAAREAVAGAAARAGRRVTQPQPPIAALRRGSVAPGAAAAAAAAAAVAAATGSTGAAAGAEGGDVEDAADIVVEEDMPMYFTDPKQLLAISLS